MVFGVQNRVGPVETFTIRSPSSISGTSRCVSRNTPLKLTE